MKAIRLFGIMAAAAVLAAAAAQAESPKLRQRMGTEEAELKKNAQRTNEECGTSITVKFDWAGVPEEELSTYSANGYCDAALEGIRRVCSDPIGKDAVKEKIKRVTCGFGSPRTISLKDGALDYKIDFKATNSADFVYEAMENAL